jgi:hypothetical protein
MKRLTFILFLLISCFTSRAQNDFLIKGFVIDTASNIDMILKSQLLAAGKQPITIKGDTTEYDAASFKMQPNSKVEDLLKQLPGIKVDKDSKITAQGQTVNKVLMDGEEFFGDDPTLVTKNIRSDMVDKVQLYDKQSDQAAFTGVDDGQKTKTINIQLKEDSKKGYLGKLEGALGNDEFYQAQGMVNKFRGKEKMAAYGTIGNTGKVGLGWRDGVNTVRWKLQMTGVLQKMVAIPEENSCCHFQRLDT